MRDDDGMETRHLRILQLECDDAVTHTLAEALAPLARICAITRIRSMAEFEAAWRESDGGYDMVIATCSAPWADRLRALETVRAIAPGLPFLFITPPLADAGAAALLRAGAFDLVPSDRLEELPGAVERARYAQEIERERLAARSALAVRNGLLQTITQAHALVLEHDNWREACAVLLRHAIGTTGAVCGMLAVREKPERLAALFVGPDGAGWKELPPGDDLINRAIAEGQSRTLEFEGGSSSTVLGGAWPRLAALRVFPLKSGADVVGAMALGRSDGSFDRRVELSLETLAPACALVASTRRRGVANEELQAQFQQAQKLEAVGRLAGGVAHDFNNLLSVINGYAELTLDELPDGHPVRNSVEQIQRAGQRAAALTRQLLLFSRKSVVHLVPARLDESVRNLRKMLTRIVGEDIELTLDLPDQLASVVCDVGQLEQAITNLVVNARDAMERGGTIALTVRQVALDAHPQLSPGRYVTVAVRDTGSGMDERTVRQIFEPFFTTKEAGKGTGLGLSTVYSIMQMHHGAVDVASAPGAGSTFTLLFPVSDEKPQEEACATPHRAGGRETVLLVEDDDDLRNLVNTVLSRAGYTVIPCASGDSAVGLPDAELAGVDVVLTDVVMPGIRGPDCADRLREKRPGLPVIYMSGYADTAMIPPEQLERLFPLLQKPVSPAKLLASMREACDARRW